MPNLPSKNNCCGCSVCIDICPQKALSLQEDTNGYFFPVLDKNKCVNCGLCEKNCHILHQDQVELNSASQAVSYAAWSLDQEIIKRSASGGIFGQIAHDFLLTPNSYVYGAAFLEDGSVHHIEVSCPKDLPKLQNSKYQQSNPSGVYQKVIQRLKEGARVLFSGVPCQVSGLQYYAKNKKIPTENLYTIQILCHGTPTNAMARLALRLNNAKRIVSYRTKSRGWGNGNRVTYEYADGSKKECAERQIDFLFRSYLAMNFFRPSCYSCHYTTPDRATDILAFDFWEAYRSPKKDLYENYMGTSVAIAYTKKGLDMLQESNMLHLQPVDWEEFLPYNQNLFMPTNKQMYIGSNYVHLLSKTPRIVQKFVYQNGFTNLLLDKIYRKILSKLLKRKNNAILSEIKNRAQQALDLIKG